MDIIILREIATVVSFLTFVGILFYAAHPRNKQRFEQEGRKVLEDETLTPALSQGRGSMHE